MTRLWRIVVLGVLLLNLMPSSTAHSSALDWDLPNGHFFTQANGYHLGSNPSVGFAVTDEGGVLFWSEFKRLGGVAGVGFPISRRFEWDGFTTQVFQKAVFQWRPEISRVYFVNVFDQMHMAGKDDWLASIRSTPRPLGEDFDAGKSWPEILAARRSLLEANPAIQAKYSSVQDPLNVFGLPTSPVEDNGNHYAVRFQRAVIQQWKEDVPWARKGQVTVANGGDVGKEAGLFPQTALTPQSAGNRRTSDDGQTTEFRGLWVVATDVTSEKKIRDIVRRAKENNFNALIVQVRSRGDAYYRSDLAVRPEALKTAPPEFDPLEILLREAHAEGLEVHAWMNTLLAWSSTTPPTSPWHVFNRHREWFMIDQNVELQGPGAKSVSDKYYYEPGAYLCPANPEVRAYLVAVFREVVNSYPVDGVHFDYIRFPMRSGAAGAALCYCEHCVSQFRQQFGVDPPRKGTAAWSTWQQQWDQWKEDQVTQVVRDVAKAVKDIRQDIRVSAAVSAASRWDIALGRTHQDWRAWLEEGILDFAVPMLYFDESNPGVYPPGEFDHYASVAVDTGNADTRHRVYPGVAAYLNSATDLARQIELARRAGANGFVVFSNGAMDDSYVRALSNSTMATPTRPPSVVARKGSSPPPPPRPVPDIPLGQLSFVAGGQSQALDRLFYTRQGKSVLSIEQQGIRKVIISFAGSPGEIAVTAQRLESQEKLEVDLSAYVDLARNKFSVDEHLVRIKIVAEGEVGAHGRFIVKDSY
ncbi:MAG: family 10 glycosylhydrolase [Chloroflexi bacterium]|nr:family 10 glycosylhydrolase [Chloroflexota bacterium]